MLFPAHPINYMPGSPDSLPLVAYPSNGDPASELMILLSLSHHMHSVRVTYVKHLNVMCKQVWGMVNGGGAGWRPSGRGPSSSYPFPCLT